MRFVKPISRLAGTTLIAAFFLGLFSASGQDVPPPPKPKDDGPSLTDTMKFIEEKLGSIV
jgi:hypothetical protein